MIDVSDKISVERVTEEKSNGFFGYYDISPESPDGKNILVNIPPFTDHMPLVGDELIIGYINELKEFTQIGVTTAWNFQEGCRLQWLDKENVIYNIIEGEKIKSVVFNLKEGMIVRKYDMPVYSVNTCTQRAVSYNLYRSRYCYAHEADKENTDYSRDGIFVLDLQSGKYNLLISLQRLAEDVNGSGSKTWVEHAVLNPVGDRFFFFHRWESESKGYFTRFCVSDMEGNMQVLLDSGACSHSGWLNDRKITAWARIPSKFNAMQKNGFLQKTGLWKLAVDIYHATIKKPGLRQKFTNEAYVIFDVEKSTVQKIDNREFVMDGHETWSKNERFMLTDTYPNEENERRLMLYDSRNDIIYFLGDYYSYPEKDTEAYKNIPGIRCDLHPKWSFGEKYVYFDSTHEGYRGLYRIDVSELMA